MNLFKMDDLTNRDLHGLLDLAQDFKANEMNEGELKHKSGALLFYEPSTRTKLSFEMACHKLGIQLLAFSKETSSVTKGESLYDTVKTIEALGADFVVIRHPEEQYYKQLEGVNIPMINGGDGSGEHPSQCLLDLMTIKEQFNEFSDLNVTICGDIKHSRVAKSNAHALNRLGANVRLAAKEKWQDPELPYSYVNLDDALTDTDVLMLLRVQAERHDEQSYDENSYLKKYGLTIERESLLPESSIIMHPAPFNRGVEIDSSLVESSKSKIFTQMENGVYIRQAIIYNQLHKGGALYENINPKYQATRN
ncbi:aspartate carbamoyltransferase catalytic subunit [Alkalibacillus haloalkaliphilus]|uniref:aspartate carbamoyltransferase catalytic subunit n=1 Tax=Alkalibacillus haloalkaliphilus TaxID=94136 RepID=UPI0029365F52|nr:aspartate carbamoyltransferase catalytic subunit [Alkalibacillus haloalkaliphilus]MDV2582569.1 aspartate carbamoyltransferase catalytic subunit [Alkalibacillus haloalkaliphilus]